MSISKIKEINKKKEWIKHNKFEPIGYGKIGVYEEYLCQHGIGHEMGVHGCDGCCSDSSFKKLYKK